MQICMYDFLINIIYLLTMPLSYNNNYHLVIEKLILRNELFISKTYISAVYGVLSEGYGKRNPSTNTLVITCSLFSSLYGSSPHSSNSHSKTA